MTLRQLLRSLRARNSPEQVNWRQYMVLWRTYLGPQRLRVALMALFLLASIALQLLGPQLIRLFIDTFQQHAGQQVLALIALGYLGIAIGGRLVSALASYLCEDVGWRATNRLREDLAQHCLQLDRSFHGQHTPGELLERIDSDVDVLANFFSQFVIQVIGSGILMLGILILMGRENLWFGLILGAYIVLSIFVFARIQRLSRAPYKRHRQAQAALSGFWGEVLQSLEDIAASGAARYILLRYFSLQRQENRAELTSIYWWAGLETVGIAIELLSTLLMLVLCGYFFVRGALTAGTLVLLLSYTAQLLDRTFDLTDQFGSLQEVTASIERINEIYHTTSRVQDGPGVVFPAGALAIAFESVAFQYEPDRPVLHDISFEVAPGEVVGLIGRSGSGKSTLIRLLLRFYDPETGSVRVGGNDLRQAKLDELRGRVGLVTQEVQLFRASLRANLTFFDDAIADQRILAAIEELGIMPWYTRLPRGLDTELAGNGSDFSAGESQLLACIRVFLKDPQLIILDEATSRLDPLTEQLITQAIEKLLIGRTAIIIAHRLQTVERVDRIMVLEAGHIVEYDQRSVLRNRPDSRYAQLLTMSHPEEMLA
ncbi:ABC transporter ATP-binding protein [Dictyobacter formicarum]|uniref:Helicase n=1 Tax=Dictyobacter formicarum TaxID=2778368 RepID=A0ABQ3VK34_9CHLR|nr:ABC transporter ATP-binding protein [Dictyobacter formicarum]GHO85751.1 helicase [Dictyobacter formicarum]